MNTSGSSLLNSSWSSATHLSWSTGVLKLYSVIILLSKKYVDVRVIADICCWVGAAAGWLWVCAGGGEGGGAGEETSNRAAPISGWHLLINFTVYHFSLSYFWKNVGFLCRWYGILITAMYVKRSIRQFDVDLIMFFWIHYQKCGEKSIWHVVREHKALVLYFKATVNPFYPFFFCHK